MELMFERSTRGLMPIDEDGWKLLNRLEIGSTVSADIKDPSRRSGRQHRFFFALITQLYQNQTMYKSLDHFRKGLLIHLGYCEVYPTKGGQDIAIANSLKFGKMPPDQFQALVEEVLGFAVSLGWDRDALLEQTQDFQGYWDKELVPA